MPTPLVTPDELRALGEGVTVLDVRYRMGGPNGAEEFEAGHIPGAAYVDLDSDLASPVQPGVTGGRHPLPAQAEFEEAMRRAGIRNGSPVVAYDDWGGRAAARAWWLLRHHGHDDVRVLDGGWRAWVDAGGPVETGPTTPVTGDFTAQPGRQRVVSAGTVMGVEVLVDARAPERFAGDVEPVDPVAGHVPGAVNVPTEDNLTQDGRFRPAAELRGLYAAVGAVPGVDVAAYCGSGVTACHDLLALEITGVRAALYAGSWSDWVSDPSRPVESVSHD